MHEKLLFKSNTLQSIVFTDFEKWYIFDVAVFEHAFLGQKNLIQAFHNWKNAESISTKQILGGILKRYIEQFEGSLKRLNTI